MGEGKKAIVKFKWYTQFKYKPWVNGFKDIKVLLETKHAFKIELFGDTLIIDKRDIKSVEYYE